MGTKAKAVVILEMPEELREALDVWAYQHEMNRSEAVRNAVAAMIGKPELAHSPHGHTRYASVEAQKHEKYLRRKARKAAGQ